MALLQQVNIGGKRVFLATFHVHILLTANALLRNCAHTHTNCILKVISDLVFHMAMSSVALILALVPLKTFS